MHLKSIHQTINKELATSRMRAVLSLTISSSHEHCAVSILIIAELTRSTDRKVWNQVPALVGL